MVKCYNCGQTNNKIDTPRLCPGCGHIMIPVLTLIITIPKKKQEKNRKDKKTMGGK